MKKSKVSKDKKQVERQQIVNLAMSSRGQFLMGKLFYYGLQKLREVEKAQPYIQNKITELERLKRESYDEGNTCEEKCEKITEMTNELKDIDTNDIKQLEEIGNHLYSPYIAVAQFSEEFDDKKMFEQLKSAK